MVDMEGQVDVRQDQSPRYNFRAIRWNPNRALFLDRLYRSAPLSMQCNQSSGERFPGYWNGIPVPEIHFPIKEVKRNCSKV
ncbi:unnamed protein product [Oppiella nova]|uniref:Uncharacterized protein n=1 Tax=Oppiella nova TaxID=334625 RepID=A0A7R9ML17_9ACAR|nr:unnamed protein product [Oppiella nova]CAD7662360.1 unnamed protein product [Oppiella nova]CAG2178396.1 unnamed protein product [Oppiella nova]CAG2179496.1 unnamed protein product [Oppiella nova]